MSINHAFIHQVIAGFYNKLQIKIFYHLSLTDSIKLGLQFSFFIFGLVALEVSTFYRNFCAKAMHIQEQRKYVSWCESETGLSADAFRPFSLSPLDFEIFEVCLFLFSI